MDLPKLRTSGRAGPKQLPTKPRCPGFSGQRDRRVGRGPIEATGLVPADKLAPARGRAKQERRSRTVVLEEGVATSEGIARTLASRFQLPFVDLALMGVQHQAAEKLPACMSSTCLMRSPYALEGDSLRIVVVTPETPGDRRLRLGTRPTLELAVARARRSSTEIKRLVRASEAFGARAAVDDERRSYEEEDGEADLEVDDGISDARSSASSTRSSSRRPRTGRATSTSSRRRIRSSSGSASTACCTRCSASRSG